MTARRCLSLAALLVALVLAASPLRAATTYDTAQTPSTFTTIASSPWAVGNFTPAAGSNRMALCGVGYGSTAGAGATTTAVALGGQSMTQVGTTASDSNWASLSVWRLNEAGIAAMSGAALSVTFTGAASQGGVVCFTLTNAAGTISSPQTGGATGVTAQPGTAVTSTSDGLVISIVMTDAEGGFSAQSGSNDSGTLTSAAIGSDTLIAAQYQSGTGGSVTPTFTQALNGYAVVAFNVDASGGGGSTANGLGLLGVGK